MLASDRNRLAEDSFVLSLVEDAAKINLFDCGDDDLNDYFHNDAKLHKAELLTQSYCLRYSMPPNDVVALLDFCNDAVQINWRKDPIKRTIKIDHRKRYNRFPAVKLTRFGVRADLQRKSVGSHALNLVKKLFTTDNRTGCRLLTVDAYNKPEVLGFYRKNEFKEFTDADSNEPTRSLYFDLKRVCQ